MPADNVTAVFELITPVVVKPGMYMGKFVINVYLISMVQITGQRFALRERGRTVGAGIPDLV